jgi:hypothetical protein
MDGRLNLNLDSSENLEGVPAADHAGDHDFLPTLPLEPIFPFVILPGAGKDRAAEFQLECPAGPRASEP